MSEWYSPCVITQKSDLARHMIGSRGSVKERPINYLVVKTCDWNKSRVKRSRNDSPHAKSKWKGVIFVIKIVKYCNRFSTAVKYGNIISIPVKYCNIIRITVNTDQSSICLIAEAWSSAVRGYDRIYIVPVVNTVSNHHVRAGNNYLRIQSHWNRAFFERFEFKYTVEIRHHKSRSFYYGWWFYDHFYCRRKYHKKLMCRLLFHRHRNYNLNNSMLKLLWLSP